MNDDMGFQAARSERDLMMHWADSLQRVEFDLDATRVEQLASPTEWGREWVWVVWAVFAVLVLVYFVMWRNRRRALKNWPALSSFLREGGGVDAALDEFHRLELLVGLANRSLKPQFSEWYALSDSERIVALGTLMDKSTKELAMDLACTPSYIYNIRASIRKKWELDAEVNLRSAIAERYAQTGTPFPSELKLEE